MDRLHPLQLFLTIVERGSFAAAAERLDIPRPTATHAIKELETRLGARLLERTTRHVRPTLDGQAFYERSRRVLAELDDAVASLSTQTANPRGTLRLDLHGTHATHIILPRIADFRARYPEIEIVLSSGDRLGDLVREGIDCVVRAGGPRGSPPGGPGGGGGPPRGPWASSRAPPTAAPRPRWGGRASRRTSRRAAGWLSATRP